MTMANTFELFSITKDGTQVYMSEETREKHIHCSIQDLHEALKEKISLTQSGLSLHTVMFDKVIGKNRLVSVTPEDKVVEWQRPFREGKTRFVLNRKSECTNQLNVVIDFDDKLGEYVIITAYPGEEKPQEPWDPDVRDKEASEKFWATHAMIPDTRQMVAMKHAGIA